MKRENFLITCSDGRTATKHKWNSAIRQTEAMAGETAKAEGTNYSLTGSDSVKDDSGFYYVKGSRQWTGENGRVLLFTVEKQGD